MKDKQLYFQKAIVSLLGVGYIRPLSATWGSLAAGVILYAFWPGLDLWMKALIIVITFVIGWIFTEQIEAGEKLHDPHFVVIDEAVGMMIVGLFLPQIWWQWLLAFILFRIFDIAKLWPASIFDKRPGGFAAMIDDVIMSVPALAALELIIYFQII